MIAKASRYDYLFLLLSCMGRQIDLREDVKIYLFGRDVEDAGSVPQERSMPVKCGLINWWFSSLIPIQSVCGVFIQ